jgi:hypothetical protein
MRRWLLSAIVIAAAGAPVAEAHTCKCDSGTCSASVTCQGAWYAICPRAGGCEAGCLDNSEVPADQLEGPAGAVFEASRGTAEVTITADAATPQMISRVLSEALAAPVQPFGGSAPIALDIQGAPAAKVVELLSNYGVVAVGKRSAARQESTLGGTRLTLKSDAIAAADLSDVLSRALGEEVVVRFRTADERIAIDLQDAPVAHVLQILTRYGDVTAGGEPVREPREQ